MRSFYSALLLSLCFAPAVSHAQMIYKGLGTSNSTFLLGHTSAVHTQCLYIPGDFNATMQGDITRLYFRYGSTGEEVGNTLGDLRIRLKQTNETGFQNGNIYFTGLEMVLHAETYVIPPGITGDWFHIDLDTPFPFDPMKTLVLDIMFATTATTTFGTYGTSNDDRKLRSPDTTSTTGHTTSISWQDLGLDITTPTGVEHIHTASGFSLSPVPAYDVVWLDAGGYVPPPDAVVQLMDVQGRVLSTERMGRGSGRHRLALHGHAAGVYLVRVVSEGRPLFEGRVLRE